MTNHPNGAMFQSAQASGRARGATPSFVLRSSEAALYAFGQLGELEPGPAATLAPRVAAFFAANETADLLVGSLPFDRAAHDYLFQPLFTTNRLPAREGAPATPRALPATLTAQPSAQGYAQAVAQCLARMAEDPQLRKVVLSRSLLAQAEGVLDPVALVDGLAQDPSITAFLASLPGLPGESAPVLVGATPELLVSKSGRKVVSHPLAGSARRVGDAGDDAQVLAALLASDKDRREHAAVVEAVLDTLSPFCSDLWAPPAPAGCSTATMWHLGTHIEGVLKSGETDVAELVAALHPTPAVCGLPRDYAQAVIAELEAYDRGFYAGAVGWLDRAGDGAWYVSLRCAQIRAGQARLYAGAGIVRGSDPQAEARETSAKFLPMLRALGLEEPGTGADEARP